MSPTLYADQTKFLDDILAQYRLGRRSVLGVASTGFGKTITFSSIATRAAAKGNSVIIAAHRQEIVDQISIALDRFGVRHGRIQPGFSRTVDPVQVAMIQTLKRRSLSVPEPNLLIIDEAHHVASSTYMDIIAGWKSCRILGVTATPERLDGRGLGDVFEVIVEAPPLLQLINMGRLADFEYFAPPAAADLSHVATRAGDFAIDQLAAAMDKATVIGNSVEHYRQHLQGRPAIAFCVTVAHAEHVAEEFRRAGYRAESVDGKLEKSERRRRIEGIGNGHLNVLTSCNLLSEGVDVPVVTGAILLRRTKSLAMFLQQIGRVLRIKPDGSRAVILDHVGNVNLHGSPKSPRLWSLNAKRRKDREASVRQCKVCYGVWGAGEKSECAARDNPECLFTSVAKPAEPFVAPEYVPGVLEMVAERPAWAGGIDILRASGDEWRSLVARARTKEQLAEIARARNYKPNWPYVILSQRKQRGEGRAA